MGLPGADLLLLVRRRDHLSVLSEQLRGAVIIALLPVHGGDFPHLLIGEGKVEQVQVGLDVVGGPWSRG